MIDATRFAEKSVSGLFSMSAAILWEKQIYGYGVLVKLKNGCWLNMKLPNT